MTYDLFRYIFIGCLVLSIVMLITTILLFFLLNIKSAIGDISGSSKRKAIENINNKNRKEASKKKPEPKYDAEKQTTSARLAAESMATSKISPQDRYDVMEASETTALNAEPVSETTVLNAVAEETETEAQVITDDISPVLTQADAGTQAPDFSVEIDITYVHSHEVVR